VLLELEYLREIDRLRVGRHAILESPLLTRDESIRRHYPRATW
jgi:hypothetical protein